MRGHTANIQIAVPAPGSGRSTPSIGQGIRIGNGKQQNAASQINGSHFKLAVPKAFTEAKRLKMLTMATRQLAIMTRAGTPLVTAVQGLTKQINDEQWRDALIDVHARIEQGETLADAMRHRPECFDPITCALVAAGEQSGQLQDMLVRLSDLARKQLSIRNGIAGAMVYPALLVAIVTIVFGVTLTAVVPRFEKMFASLNAPLPPTTQALVWLSGITQSYWWLMLPIGLVTVILAAVWSVSPSGRLFMDRTTIKLPVFGPLTRSVATTKIIRLLAELMDSHLPLLEVIQLVKATAGNHLYIRVLQRAEDAVTHGEPMSLAFDEPDLISPSVYEAIRVGEESGKTSEALLSLADFLEEDNDQMIKSLTTLLEPAILLFLGLVVAGLAVSLFLPLFDLSAIAGDGSSP